MNKKIVFSVVLLGILAFNLVFISCGGEASKLAGIWEAEGDAHDTMELFKDGTGVFSDYGGTWKGTWKIENKRFMVTALGELESITVDYKLSGSILTITTNGKTTVFLKKKQGTNTPAVITEEVNWALDTGADNIVFFISNDSNYVNDEIITLTLVDGNGNPIERSITQLEMGTEERISTTANYYLVHIRDGVNIDYFFPSNRIPTRMSGEIYLSFNGDKIARYAVLRDGSVRFE